MNQVSRSNAKSGASLMLLSATLMFLSGGVLAAPQAGDRVLGQWKDGYWYPATVKQIQGETVSLRFDDGATAQAAPNQLASLDWAKGTRVECNWKNGGKFYRGVISSRAQDRLAIAYDDGDKESTRVSACRSKSSGTALTGQPETKVGGGESQRKQENLAQHRKAAEQGDAVAQFNLAFMYSNGEGIRQDKQEAVKWYLKAAEQGNAHAQNDIGWMYFKGDGVRQDKQEALKWLKMAAEKGNHNALTTLGLMFYQGDSVHQDKREALILFRKAAKQGSTVAQRNLGNFHSQGDEYQDKREAEKWYRLAAEGGDTYAQYKLAHILHDSDYPKAVAWYMKASEQGHREATNAVQEARDWAREEAPNGNKEAIAVAKTLGIRIDRKLASSRTQNSGGDNCVDVFGYDGFTGSKAKTRRICRSAQPSLDLRPSSEQHGHYVSPHEAPMPHEQPMAHEAPMPHEEHMQHEAPRLYR